MALKLFLTVCMHCNLKLRDVSVKVMTHSLVIDNNCLKYHSNPNIGDDYGAMS